MSTAVAPAERPPEALTPATAAADPTHWPKAVPLLVLAGLIAYANCFTKVFILDDAGSITGNPYLAADPVRYVFSSQNRVLVRASIALNYMFGGLNTVGYHAFNVAVHVLAGLTLYGLVRRVLLLPRFAGRYADTAPFLAFAVALLWLVHPLQTQAVTYVIQRAESMMGLFYLFTLYAWVRGATGGGRAWYALAVGGYALSCASKEIALTLPPVLVIFDRVFLARSWRDLARRWPAYLGLLAVWGVALRPTLGLATGEVSGAGIGSGAGGTPTTRYQYLLTQAGVILHYLRLSAWPVGQSLDYLDWPIAKSFGEVWPQFLAVAGLFAASVILLFVRPAVGFLGVWFFFILAPTSSIVPIVDPAFEHRMYLSLAAVVAAVVFAAEAGLRAGGWPDRKQRVVGGVVLGVAATALIALTHARNETYRSTLAAATDAATVRPNNTRAVAALADEYRYAGDLDEADRLLRRVQELSTVYTGEYVRQRALWYVSSGRLPEAEQYLAAITSAGIDSLTPFFTRHRVWVALGLGKPAEAAGLARWLNETIPGVADDELMLAAAELAAGNEAAARAAAAAAHRRDPRAAARASAEARGYVLATPPKTEAVHKPQALWLAAAACLADPDPTPVMFDTLAMAHAWNGQFPQAAGAARKGIAAAEKREDADWANALRDRLKLYEAGKPYEGPAQPAKKS